MKRSVPLWTLLVSCVVSVLIGIWVDNLLWSHSTSDATAKETKLKEASAELAAARTHLDASEMQNAYDALLAAMRVAPEDLSVFETSLEFIRNALKDENYESELLAQDIHQRAANLIPFLPLAKIKAARIEHTKVGDELFADKKDANREDRNPSAS